MKLPEILLVEDSQTDAELTLRALKLKQFANQVTWVKDGAEALEYLFCEGQYEGRSNGHPCLVLLDLKMPKVDGIEVLRRIKNDERTKTVPVVMLTSSAEERDVVEGYQLGVNSYIVKPVDFDQFMTAVSEAGCYWATLNRLPNLL
ncbi:MAG TPA: response regulator [Burkholderiales bacterium]|nr:response regulator [Burkholderiales bacterium]